MKKYNLDFEVAGNLLIEMKYTIKTVQKNVGMLDVVILDIIFALNRYCLWSWDYSVHALRYAIASFENSFCY